MIWVLIIYTTLPTWFVGPLVPSRFTPDSPPVYIMGPSLLVPIQHTPDGVDRMVILVDPPPPPPVPPGGTIKLGAALPPATPQPAVRPPERAVQRRFPWRARPRHAP